MKQYLSLLQEVLDKGEQRPDRTGVGTIGVFGAQRRYDLRHSFPLVTTKKVLTKSVIGELLWFLSGSTNVNDLHKYGVGIWDDWADESGDLGPVYSHQWRSWSAPNGEAIDQISRVIDAITHDPFSRRHIVSAWNVADIDQMALPPCHLLFQFHVSGDRELSCQLYQRSADLFLGVPFNIASYAILTHMVAQQCGLRVGDFVHTIGDAHIYQNHVEQVQEQLSRIPLELPQLQLNYKPSIFEYTPEDIVIQGYNHHDFIKAPIAI